MRRLTFKDEFGRYIYSPDTDLGEVIDRLAWYENFLSDVTPNVKAKWIRYPDCGVTRCSRCGWSIEECWDSKRCPECGAYMKEENNND